MTTAKPLRKKQVREIVQTIQNQFNIDFPLNEYQFYLNSKDKIFILKQSPHLESINLEFIRTDRMGLYFAEYKNKFFRPSMQGAQLIMQIAKTQKIAVKNTLELSKTEAKAFFAGVDLNLKDQKDSNALILTHKHQAIGFAQIKEGKLLNYLPKTFRGTTII
jgi:NOL1/NOP2/fmu family ribosome biogenesis protein